MQRMTTSMHYPGVPITEATLDSCRVQAEQLRKLRDTYLRERGELHHQTAINALVGSALILADLTRKLAEHALSLTREGNAEGAARAVEFLRTSATDEPTLLEWLAGEADRLAAAGYEIHDAERLLPAAESLGTLYNELGLGQSPKQVRISPLAFLRSVLAIAWSAFRSPFTTTTIDLSTGRVIAEE